MMAEANVKTKQLRIIKRYINKSTGAKFFSKEDIRDILSDLICIDFIEFNKHILNKDITYWYKHLDEVLSLFLIDKKMFANYDNINYLCIIIGGDHGKGQFTMLMTLYVE